MAVSLLGTLTILALLAFLFLRQPVWLALAFWGILGNVLLTNFNVAALVAATKTFDTARNYNLSVIPLFILMGEIATGSRLSSELFRAARVILSGLKGGLAVATIGASGAFSAICGSSIATAATMTRIALPEMRKAGYDDGFASGSVAAGGTIGILIPPSIILVIYGSIAEQSISRLFAAALIPGLVLLTLYGIIAVIVAMRSDKVPSDPPASLWDRIVALRWPWQFVLLFVCTIGGIYGGIFSPNEAAAVGAFLAIVIGLVSRRLTFRIFLGALRATVITSCVLFMIVIGASIFGQFIVQTRLPELMLATAQHYDLAPWMVMLLIIFIYIVLGCFLEGIGMVLITVPLFLPIVVGYGFDPIWFGILVVVVVELGLITPPVGMNLFVIQAQVKEIAITDIYRGILPFLWAPLIMALLLLVFPQLALWFPSVIF